MMIDNTAKESKMEKQVQSNDVVGYFKTITTSCGDCGGDAKLEGFFSNGTPIHDPYMDSTYRPIKDELLKIGHIKCSDCGSEQWS